MAEDREDQRFRGIGGAEREKTVAEMPVSNREIEEIRAKRREVEEDLEEMKSENERPL